MLTRKLYRILLKGGKDLFHARNKEFLHATIASLQSRICEFTDGQKLLHRLRRNPQKAIRKAFLDGQVEDLDKLLGIFPRLNRYFRASRLLNKYAMSIHTEQQKFFLDNISDSVHNIGKGALLVSKLHYSDRDLKERDVEEIFMDAIRSMALDLKSEMHRIISEVEGATFEAQLHKQTLEERRRSRIFTVLVALDRLIKKREKHRQQSSGFVHLVDQVLDPQGYDYYRATPIVYSSIYCTLVNFLDLEVEAFGVSNPKHFLSRMSIKNTGNASLAMKSPLAKLIEAKMPVSKGRISFSCIKDLHISSVPGLWMRINDPDFSSSIMKFDRSCSTLSTYSGNRIIWQLQLTENSRPTSHIKVGLDYIGEYFHLIDGVEKVVPCTVKFSTLSTDLMSSIRGIHVYDQPYVEIEVCYKESGTANNIEGSANIIKEIEYTERYCRTSDLDWCLLDFSEKGVTPITPVDYLEHLRRQGHGKETVKKLLEPVTSAAVAARMAGNISRHCMRLDEGGNGLEDSAFWMSVRKQLEHINSAIYAHDSIDAQPTSSNDK